MLTREVNEVIRIGDNIKVTIVAIRDGKKVRVGVDAPPGIEIHRQEVYEQVQAERRPTPPASITHEYACGCRLSTKEDRCPHHPEYRILK